MNLRARIAIAATLLAGFGGVIAFLSSGANGQAAATTGTRWESAQQCKSCHEDVFAEWLGSHHQIAFTNPEVRTLSDDFRKEECMDCHLPRPLAVTGFGKRTLPRRTHFDEGVSCISCHLAADGGILARNDRPEVPCRPRASEAFLAVDACASCHMPAVTRTRKDGSTRMGRGHVYAGGHDKATLQKAGKFTVARDGDDLLLSLANVGAGHNFPTEERHRAVDMVYRFVTAAGPGEWQRAWRFRQPYRDEMEPVNPGNAPAENTQLPAAETKAVRVPVPDDATAVEARLWYRLTPFCGDDDPQSTLLDEQRLPL